MIACFLSNISAKYYKNPSMLSRVIAKNVGDVFLRHSVDTQDEFHLPKLRWCYQTIPFNVMQWKQYETYLYLWKLDEVPFKCTYTLCQKTYHTSNFNHFSKPLHWEQNSQQILSMSPHCFTKFRTSCLQQIWKKMQTKMHHLFTHPF